MSAAAFAPVVRRPTPAEAERAATWKVWTCEPSAFEWGYSATEHCLMIEGQAVVEAGGKDYAFGPGDYVVFPKGLACKWKVTAAVRKYYWFDEA